MSQYAVGMNLPELPILLMYLQVAAILISSVAFLMALALILSARRHLPQRKRRPAFPYLYDKQMTPAPRLKEQTRETTLV
jgi:hypothetical protein